jgi:predicted DNA-binding transcriptional regulator AlpA
MRNRQSKKRAVTAHKELLPPAAKSDAAIDFITGPKLRAKLGVSAVTLWRWRHKQSGFPQPKVINGRTYYPMGAVSDWLARQPEAA